MDTFEKDDEVDLSSFQTPFPGDSKRDFNPTCYRTDAQYSHMVSTIVEDVPEKEQKFGFDIVLKKKVQTYVEVESSDPNWPLGGTLIVLVLSQHPTASFFPRWKIIQTRSVGSWRRFSAPQTPRTDSPHSSSSWTTSSTPTVGSCAMRRCLAPAMSARVGPAPPR